MPLHITNGDSAADVIKACGVPGDVLSWRDPMHHGPCPPHASLDELSRIRIDYLAGDDKRSSSAAHGFSERDAMLIGSGEYDEVVLWFEHDLLDQLQLLQLLSWYAQYGKQSTSIWSLICIDDFEGVQDFRGIGQLSVAQMASLYPQRVPISQTQLAMAQQFWAAFCANDPSELQALCLSPIKQQDELPFLIPAIRRHLQEFPWVSDGLTRTERQILQLANSGVGRPAELFVSNMDLESCLYIGDWRTYAQIAALCEAMNPLLQCFDGKTFQYPPSTTLDVNVFNAQQLVVTDYGRAVLNEEANALTTMRRNSWLGGVHLDSAESLWCWNDADQWLSENTGPLAYGS